MSIIVGYTGTQIGMNALQLSLLESTLARLCPREFHHGDCDGGDKQAHDIVRRVLPNCWIVLHPPINEAKRAFCVGNETRKARPYLARNKEIVACIDELIGAPRTRVEQLRSGTWSTIRYARKAQIPVHLLLP